MSKARHLLVSIIVFYLIRQPALYIYKYNIICSGDARLDPMVNRIRHELLIAKRRVHNAAEGKSIDFNPSMKGKTLPPSMIKYTYWAPKVLLMRILMNIFVNF